VTAQKLADRCASDITKRLTIEERLTKVKFITVGSVMPPPPAPDPRDPFAKPPPRKVNVTIVFAKRQATPAAR
jgi:hypothetical protein